VIAPLRGSAPVFRSIAYATLDAPVPGLPPVIRSHDALLVAVHVQCAGAVTVRLPVAASLPYDAVDGLMSTVHAPRPASSTETVCPAMVSAPVRVASPELAVTVTVTAPLPVPDAPEPMVIQPRSEVAVHAHWLAVLTLTDAEPPFAPKDSDDADTVKAQGLAGSTGESLSQAASPTRRKDESAIPRGVFLTITSRILWDQQSARHEDLRPRGDSRARRGGKRASFAEIPAAFASTVRKFAAVSEDFPVEPTTFRTIAPMRRGRTPARASFTLASMLLLGEIAGHGPLPSSIFQTGYAMTPITTILVPTDFSSSSGEALDYARGLAAAVGASLHLIHVIENPFVYGMYSDVYIALPPDYLDGLDRAAQTRLEAQLTSEEKDRFRAEFITRIGIPAREILEYLSAHPEVGLVVMASAGRGGVARLLIGSVADKIVRGAPCPVMTVHPQHHGEGRESTIAA